MELGRWQLFSRLGVLTIEMIVLVMPARLGCLITLRSKVLLFFLQGSQSRSMFVVDLNARAALSFQPATR